MREGRDRLDRLAALTVAVFACAAGSAPAGKFHGVVSQGQLTDADYNRMRSGKVGTLRVNVRWSNVQPNAGTPAGRLELGAVRRGLRQRGRSAASASCPRWTLPARRASPTRR